jgi:hypothetical protein
VENCGACPRTESTTELVRVRPNYDEVEQFGGLWGGIA